MGGSGSGRTKRSYAIERVIGASEKNQTKETKNFVERLKGQAGDRMFSVDRKYRNGQWFTVGNVADPREETVGATFGGGEYRLYELNKATEARTDKPPLAIKISPAAWPVNPTYAQNPEELELEQLRDQGDEPAARGMSRADLTETEARIESRIRRELELQNRITELERELKFQAAHQLQAQAVAPAMDPLAMMREMMGLVKELMPPPAFGGPQLPPTTPLQALRESLETVKLLQTEMGALGQGPQENKVLAKLTDGLVELGTKALTAYKSNGATPAPRPAQVRTLQAANVARPAAQGPGPAAAPVPAPPQPQPSADVVERDYQLMLNDLRQRLADDQVDQLGPNPITHLSETAAWVQQRWTGDEAPTVWANLRELFKKYPDDQVTAFLGMNAPELMDTDQKKAWLLELVKRLRTA